MVEFGAWRDDFAAAMQFLTRLPAKRDTGAFDLRRGGRVLPLVGAVVGTVTGASYWLFLMLHVPPFAAAALTLAVSVLMTGGLHEDGLADTADGFGGGRSKERKLEIMSDSRIGSYGVLALALALLTKAGCLASLDGWRSASALIVAHVLARTAVVFVAFALPPAKQNGLGASANRPSGATVAIAGLIGIVIAAVCSPALALPAIAGVAATTAAMGSLAHRQIGGFTGDVLGTVEQLGETAVLIAASIAR